MAAIYKVEILKRSERLAPNFSSEIHAPLSSAPTHSLKITRFRSLLPFYVDFSFFPFSISDFEAHENHHIDNFTRRTINKYDSIKFELDPARVYISPCQRDSRHKAFSLCFFFFHTYIC